MLLERKRSIVAILCVSLSILFTYIICIYIRKDIPIEFSQSVQDLFTVNLSAFEPEPLERLRFIFSIIFLPTSLLLLNLLLNKIFGKYSDEKLKVLYYFLCSVVCMSLLLLFLFYSKNTDNHFFIGNNYVFSHPKVSLIFYTLLILVALFLSKATYGKKMLHFIKRYKTIIDLMQFTIIILIAVFISLTNVYSINFVNDSGMFVSHLNAVFHSVGAVHMGDNLLVDFVNQYGLYPHFLELLFQLIGLSILKFTIVMSLLNFLTFILIYRVLNELIKNKALVFLGYMVFVYFGYVHLKIFNNDPYFQYFPIRTIYPILLIYCSLDYFKGKTKLKYYLYTCIFSTSILWNLDTGLIVFIAWLMVLIFDELVNCEKLTVSFKKILMHFLILFCIVSFVILFYGLMIYVRSGIFPNLFNFVKYQVYFYGYGFYMLPMKLIHPWNLIALIYIIGIYFSCEAIVVKDKSVMSKMIFLISILGVGIFSYYQGRSHDHVLALVWYPSFLLVALFTYKTYVKVKIDLNTKYFVNPIKLCVFITLIIFSCSAVLSFLANVKPLYELISNQIELSFEQKETNITSGIGFIKDNSIEDEELLILSYHSGIYYSYSHTNPSLSIPGTSELFLIEDYNKIYQAIDNQDLSKIFIDQNFFSNTQINYSSNMKVLELLCEKYDIVDRNQFNNILMLKKKDLIESTVDKKTLFEEGNSYLHVYVKDRFYVFDSMSDKLLSIKENLSGVNLMQQFTIEMMVNPEDTQVPYAALIGNHPGDGNQGFIIEQDNDNQNVYNFIYGDGSEWSQPLTFSLVPNKVSYLSLTLNNGDVRVYIDGRLENSIDNNLNKYENSNMPLSIGNWINMDRYFNGEISEVKIINEALAPDIISKHWELVNRK